MTDFRSKQDGSHYPIHGGEAVYPADMSQGSGEYVFHSDPGHGWLEVDIAELKRLGIAQQISGYSYRRGSRVFLEEDSDATKFINAKKERNEPVRFKESYSEHTPIRGYPHFK